MNEPNIGKENLGAVIGALVGAIGGLVAIAIPYALMTRSIHSLSAARTFGLISFLVCTPIGWFAGGYLTHFLERFMRPRTASILGGCIGGLLPVAGIAMYGWHMASR